MTIGITSQPTTTAKSPMREATRSPKAGFHDHQPSTDERYARQHQSGARTPFASWHQKGRRRVAPTQMASQRDNFNRNDLNNLASLAADQLATDLAAPINGVVLSGLQRVSFVAVNLAAFVCGNNGVRLGHCKYALKKGFRVVDGAVGHFVVSSCGVGMSKLGPMVLSVNRSFQNNEAA